MARARVRVLLLASMLLVTMIGAAGITSATRVGNEGCTPGFWLNNPGQWPADFATTDLVTATFDTGSFASFLAGDTLLYGLTYPDVSGSDLQKVQILLRAAIAAILNASHDGLGYPYGTADVIDWVNVAIASGDMDVVEALKDQLDEANNLGCPLNADESNE